MVVDVGISRVVDGRAEDQSTRWDVPDSEAASEPGGGVAPDPSVEIVGDVDTAAVAERASLVTPVPGGVGPMTVALLLQNVVTAAEMAQGLHR